MQARYGWSAQPARFPVPARCSEKRLRVDGRGGGLGRGHRRALKPKKAAAASEEEEHPSVCSVCLGLSFDPLALSNCPLSVLSLPHSFSLSLVLSVLTLTPVPPQPSCIAVGVLGLWVQGSGPGRWNQGPLCSVHLSHPSVLPVCLLTVNLLDRVQVLSQSAPLLCWVPSKPSGLGMGERGVLRRGGAPMGPP